MSTRRDKTIWLVLTRLPSEPNFGFDGTMTVEGFQVSQIINESSAWRACLKVSDYIIKFNFYPNRVDVRGANRSWDGNSMDVVNTSRRVILKIQVRTVDTPESQDSMFLDRQSYFVNVMKRMTVRTANMLICVYGLPNANEIAYIDICESTSSTTRK